MKKLFLVFISVLWLMSCGSDDTTTTGGGGGGGGGTTTDPVKLNSEVNKFVWGSMNLWYYWQPDLPLLSDTKDDNQDSFYTFLNGYSTPEKLFDALLYFKSENDRDRFSGLYNNYEALQGYFAGNRVDPGYDARPYYYKGGPEVFCVVQYVFPNSPAEKAGLKRGMVFKSIDGTALNEDNYFKLLNRTSYKLDLGKVVGSEIIDSGNSIDLTSISYVEDPVFLYKIFDAGGKKIGYLLYNGYNITSHERLNKVFKYFKDNGVTSDLILDLRYNGGGAVETSLTLASLISKSNQGKTLTKDVYNGKTYKPSDNIIPSTINYFDSKYNILTKDVLPNSLDIKNLYVIGTKGTASASEATILGFKNRLNLKLIGTNTVGKSNTNLVLYDNPEGFYIHPDNIKQGTLNTTHKYAVYSVIGIFKNVENEEVPFAGFTPDVKLNEVEYLGNGWKELGSPDELLLAETFKTMGVTVTSRKVSNTQPLSRELATDLREVETEASKFKGGYILNGSELFNKK